MKLEIICSQTKGFFDRLVQEERLSEYLDLLNDFHRETYEHILRVCLLSLDLGFENELSRLDLWYLGYAGLLHDIGKARIPRDILSTPTGLDPQEYRVVQGHVRLGFVELEDLEHGIVKEIIAAHHEFTTTPYPRDGMDRRQGVRPSGERRKTNTRIRNMAQIIAIVDIVDALIHNRSYKEAFTKKETEEILRREFTGDHKFVAQVLRRLDGEGVGEQDKE